MLTHYPRRESKTVHHVYVYEMGFSIYRVEEVPDSRVDIRMNGMIADAGETLERSRVALRFVAQPPGKFNNACVAR